jgi:hypothetical protein
LSRDATGATPAAAGSQRGDALARLLLIALVTAITGGAIAAVAAASWVVATVDSAPNLNQLQPRDPHPLTRFYAADGSLLGYLRAQTVFTYVPPQKIPAALTEATVAIEDRRFWQHGAIDYEGILRAGFNDLFGGGNSIQGASTLTMQLVNNMSRFGCTPRMMSGSRRSVRSKSATTPSLTGRMTTISSGARPSSCCARLRAAWTSPRASTAMTVGSDRTMP